MTLPDLDRPSREDERLRWVAADAATFERAAARAEAELRDDDAGRVRLLGYLGNAYRLLAPHGDPIDAHEKALDAAAAGGGRGAHSVALTRLGESYRCAGRYDQGEAALPEALERQRERVDAELVASTGRALPAAGSAG